IIRLEEISPNHWRAKYQGNYGVYTIKITTDGEKTTKFSCSCPSDYYPCKHIAMIENAIAERIAQNKNVAEKETKQNTNLTVAKLLRTVSRKELYEFIVQQARYSKKLTKTILIEFAGKTTENNSNSTNPYSVILREALRNTKLKAEEYYYRYEEGVSIEIDAFDQILIKLKTYFDQKNYHEVVLICKACIEELAKWLIKKEQKISEIIDLINPDYYEVPFKILGDVVEYSGTDLKELYDYCRSEIRNSKYRTSDIFTAFNNLFLHLALKVNPNGFIEFQDELLNEVQDKNSYDAQKILERKINLFNLNNQPQKAWEIIEENIKIASFCKKLTEKKIKEKKFTEAKKLIKDYLKNNEGNNRYDGHDWNKLLLEIAQNEKDTPTIREISFIFIQNKFDTEYFKIYKSTFNNKEWKSAFEQLFNRYLISYEESVPINWHSYNLRNRNYVFDLLVAENESKRLIELVEKYLTVNLIEQYYENFATQFPTQTLLLFRKALDDYIKNTTGSDAYEYLAKQFKKMQKINGGKEIVADMIEQYKILYKNRPSLKKILSQF
ncbi:MAG: SWIM zinc finger family protein, partial [Planctomycetaceae bacterium]|nr:SWIM zinc finger family protein [Planctomycetaceae bacterium]